MHENVIETASNKTWPQGGDDHVLAAEQAIGFFSRRLNIVYPQGCNH
jgi:hypothetical protein